MAASYDQLSVGVATDYPTQPLRPSAGDVSGASLSGFGGSNAAATTFEPASPYTLPSANGFYDSGEDSSLTPAVASMCIEVEKTFFPEGHKESSFMFPKGTVVTILGKKDPPKTGIRRLRDAPENVFHAKLGFYETAFNISDEKWNLTPEQMKKAHKDGNLDVKTQKNIAFIKEFVEAVQKQPEARKVSGQCSYALGIFDDSPTPPINDYNTYVHKSYVADGSADASNAVNWRKKFCTFATERLLPVGVLAEAVCLEPGKPKVVAVAVKGVAEVALAADFKDPKRVLPKPGQPLYLTVDGAIDQGQRALLHMLLKSQQNCAWLNALAIKVVVAPGAQDKTVLALLP